MQSIGNIPLQDLLLWGFASIALLAACSVIIAKNPVRAVLSLIVTFLATAVTWLTLDAEFLALTLVLVYVGAVLVLFLFVVMMLDINFATTSARFTRWLPIGLLLALGLFFALASVLYTIPGQIPANAPLLAYGQESSNTQALGNLVFTQYLLQFELAGIILLIAIIAAISLIYRGPQRRKVQNIAAQVQVIGSQRVHLVDGN